MHSTYSSLEQTQRVPLGLSSSRHLNPHSDQSTAIYTKAGVFAAIWRLPACEGSMEHARRRRCIKAFLLLLLQLLLLRRRRLRGITLLSAPPP